MWILEPLKNQSEFWKSPEKVLEICFWRRVRTLNVRLSFIYFPRTLCFAYESNNKSLCSCPYCKYTWNNVLAAVRINTAIRIYNQYVKLSSLFTTQVFYIQLCGKVWNVRCDCFLIDIDCIWENLKNVGPPLFKVISVYIKNFLDHVYLRHLGRYVAIHSRWCIGRLSVMYRSTIGGIGVLITDVLLK